jgi:hypothetical protein
MSSLRLAATTGLSAVLTFIMLQAIGCRTKAVGINDCREIEEARCEAAVHCGDQIPVDDVEACKRFYRDQCLHGLAIDDDPSSSAVRACVAAITSAGNCAKNDGADTRIEDCADAPELMQGFDAERLETACDVIERPQYTAACFFLNDTDDEPPAPAGEGGAGGASFVGGAAGSEGAAGASAAGDATAAGSPG